MQTIVYGANCLFFSCSQRSFKTLRLDKKNGFSSNQVSLKRQRWLVADWFLQMLWAKVQASKRMWQNGLTKGEHALRIKVQVSMPDFSSVTKVGKCPERTH